jgi:hypothetical protein
MKHYCGGLVCPPYAQEQRTRTPISAVAMTDPAGGRNKDVAEPRQTLFQGTIQVNPVLLVRRSLQSGAEVNHDASDLMISP